MTDNKNTGANKLVWKGVRGDTYTITTPLARGFPLCTTHKTLVSKVALNVDKVFTYLSPANGTRRQSST